MPSEGAIHHITLAKRDRSPVPQQAAAGIENKFTEGTRGLNHAASIAQALKSENCTACLARALQLRGARM